jgi:uncharacterized protein YciI
VWVEKLSDGRYQVRWRGGDWRDRDGSFRTPDRGVAWAAVTPASASPCTRHLSGRASSRPAARRKMSGVASPQAGNITPGDHRVEQGGARIGRARFDHIRWDRPPDGQTDSPHPHARRRRRRAGTVRRWLIAAPVVPESINDLSRSITVQFLLVARDGEDDDALARRLNARDAHIALGDQMVAEGRMLYGGAILDDADKMIGSVLVLDFPSRDAFDEWLKIEPYMLGNVWRRVDVQPFRVGPSFVGLHR